MRRYGKDIDGVNRNMRGLFIVGLGSIIVGLVMLFGGLYEYFYDLSRADERIYTTAVITKIDEIETGDSEHPIDHVVYVNYSIEHGTVTVTGKLNEYRSKYKVGDKVEIFYYNDDILSAHHIDSNKTLLLMLIFPASSVIFGAVIVFNRRVREFLAELCLAGDDF